MAALARRPLAEALCVHAQPITLDLIVHIHTPMRVFKVLAGTAAHAILILKQHSHAHAPLVGQIVTAVPLFAMMGIARTMETAR